MAQAATTPSQDARSRVMLAIVAEMADRLPDSAPTRADAEVAIARLREMSVDLQGCAVLGPGGEALAASGDLERWGGAAAGLLDAADRAAGRRASHVHVGTEDGDAFALREGDLAIVAVAERFTLASLLLFDMRTVLRDVAAAAGGVAAVGEDGAGGSPARAGRNGAGGAGGRAGDGG
jgi:hypothetical protein